MGGGHRDAQKWACSPRLYLGGWTPSSQKALVFSSVRWSLGSHLPSRDVVWINHATFSASHPTYAKYPVTTSFTQQKVHLVKARFFWPVSSLPDTFLQSSFPSHLGFLMTYSLPGAQDAKLLWSEEGARPENVRSDIFLELLKVGFLVAKSDLSWARAWADNPPCVSQDSGSTDPARQLELHP